MRVLSRPWKTREDAMQVGHLLPQALLNQPGSNKLKINQMENFPKVLLYSHPSSLSAVVISSTWAVQRADTQSMPSVTTSNSTPLTIRPTLWHLTKMANSKIVSIRISNLATTKEDSNYSDTLEFNRVTSRRWKTSFTGRLSLRRFRSIHWSRTMMAAFSTSLIAAIAKLITQSWLWALELTNSHTRTTGSWRTRGALGGATKAICRSWSSLDTECVAFSQASGTRRFCKTAILSKECDI